MVLPLSEDHVRHVYQVATGAEAARHPLIGRPCEDGLHELVISRGRTGYVALYDFYEAEDTALVLALRQPREAGFSD